MPACRIRQEVFMLKMKFALEKKGPKRLESSCTGKYSE